LLQGEVAWQVADVALETVEYGGCHGVRGYPPGGNYGCGTCGQGGADEANPFVSSGALRHPGLACSEDKGSATTQIHLLQILCPQPPIRPFGRKLQPRPDRIGMLVLAVTVDPDLAVTMEFQGLLQPGGGGVLAVQYGMGRSASSWGQHGGRRANQEQLLTAAELTVGAAVAGRTGREDQIMRNEDRAARLYLELAGLRTGYLTALLRLQLRSGGPAAAVL
jgi:hypothetical protein